MPSSKAILADINDLGLNPFKAYSETNGNGQLFDKSASVEENVVAKNALKELKPAKENEASTKKVETIETAVETSVMTEEVVKEEALEEKPKKFKKKKTDEA